MPLKKTCPIAQKEFIITDEDLVFYEKMGVPAPTLCPEERQRRRLAWQNMYKLYWRKCDATGQKTLSSLSADKIHTVYKNEYWWSDNWNAYDYGFEPNFTKPFFEQIKPLIETVPYPAMFTNYLDDENSEFTNYAGFDKDCYLIFHADMNRECMYGTGVKKCTNVIDIFNVFESELCYECVDCKNAYDLKYSQDCQNCSSSWFLKNCIGCKNCFGCMNLRQKEYYLFNKFVGKEAFEKFIDKFQSGSFKTLTKLHQQFIEFQSTQPHRATQGYQNENSQGDHIFNCQNVTACFDIQESRDMKFCERIYNGPNSDCYDVDQFGMKIQKIYEAGPIGQDCVNVIGACNTYNLVDSAYCAFTFNSHDCFGCIGIQKGKYTLFNKAYTKHEYEILRDKMRAHMKETGEWGQFFPLSLSPWDYNETLAQEYYPLKPETVSQYNGTWKTDLQKTSALNTSGHNLQKIPDNIHDIEASICNEVINCTQTGRPYKIQPAEFHFYKKMKLPLPRLHPDIRHQNRLKLRNPRQLWDRKCAQCQSDIQTTFAPERPEKVYCEDCYVPTLN